MWRLRNVDTARKERKRGRGLIVSYKRVGRESRYASADEGCKKGARDRKFQDSLVTRLKICGMVSVITHKDVR